MLKNLNFFAGISTILSLSVKLIDMAVGVNFDLKIKMKILKTLACLAVPFWDKVISQKTSAKNFKYSKHSTRRLKHFSTLHTVYYSSF